MALTGFKRDEPDVYNETNPYKHLNDLPLYHYEYLTSGHIGGHLIHEEPMLHSEEYGYVRGDDPFEPTGRLDVPLLILIFMSVIFIHFNFTTLNFWSVKPSTVWMHQRLTAGMLEDRIREFRLRNV